MTETTGQLSRSRYLNMPPTRCEYCQKARSSGSHKRCSELRRAKFQGRKS